MMTSRENDLFCISLANNRSIDVTRFDVFSNVFRPDFTRRIQKPANDRRSFLDLCLRKTLSGKSHDYRDVIFFETLRFQNAFRLHETKSRLSQIPLV